MATWQEMVSVFNPLLNDIFDGKMSVRDGLMKMQDETNALFQRAGS